MSTTPITFNGSSSYASSFQQVIQRAVGIASLPMQILQGDVTTLTNEQQATSTLGSSFQTLQTALTALASTSSGTPTASVSGGGVTANASSGALPGTYSIQVDDVGSSTVTLSSDTLPTVTDPSTDNISSASSFTLTVNGVDHTISPSGTSLSSLATAINAAGDGVQATIINVGSNSTPDYRLSLTSANLGGDTIQLNDGTNNLLDTLSTGTPALYELNGSSTQLQSTSRQITLSPGLTVNLVSQTSSPSTVTVSTDFSGLQNAISNLVSAFNSAVTAVQKNEGQNGGALEGDSLIYTLVNALNNLAETTGGSGAVTSLADLGVTLQQNGQLAFDPTVFSAANTTDIQQFLGSTTTQGSFLQQANDALNSVTDVNTGLIASTFNAFQTQIDDKNSLIADDQTRIDQLQTNLQAQLSQADAAIATLESQKTYFQELFTATYGTSGIQGQSG
ncbi:MAG TPA: flagellar filament capping protein FliD [Bryobacteraceae bacterium]|nr:flagellar filament capping protein FliD [Bryobacteraceae bacterium]